MRSNDCITVPIEIEEAVSLASAIYWEDSESRTQLGFLGGAYGRLAATAILALATSSVVLGGLEPVDVTTTFPTRIASVQTVPKHGRRISLAEACRMADELQDRIDAEYEEELQSDARVEAVWE